MARARICATGTTALTGTYSLAAQIRHREGQRPGASAHSADRQCALRVRPPRCRVQMSGNITLLRNSKRPAPAALGGQPDPEFPLSSRKATMKRFLSVLALALLGPLWRMPAWAQLTTLGVGGIAAVVVSAR